MKIKFTSIFCVASLFLGLQTQVVEAQCDTASITGQLSLCNGDTTVLTGPSVWQQKATSPAVRQAGVGFAIGSKGYVGLGATVNLQMLNDFWEYDPASDTWTQKASLPALGRFLPAGFAIGTKGYVGLGTPENVYLPDFQDFWEFDPIANTWTQKANFPGGERTYPVNFSIATKGYIGAGMIWDVNSQIYTLASSVFYEYNPVNDTWTQKANFPVQSGPGISLSIGNKGYVVGTTTLGAVTATATNNVYEYDPNNDTWTTMAQYPGVMGDDNLSGFAIGSVGYFGFGFSSNDFWKYTPSTDTWTSSFNDVSVASRKASMSFAIDSAGYVFGGSEISFNPTTLSDLWKFIPYESYTWNTGDTTQSIVVDSAGAYTLTVTFDNGCPASSETVTVVSSPLITFTGSDSICSGTSTTLTANGGASFVWSTGDSIASITVSPMNDTTYYVTVADTNGCSATDSITVFVSVCSGINELGANQNISLYPNPASNLVKISAKGALLETIKIYNLTGALVYEQAASKSEEVLNINIPAGVYYMHLKTDAGTNIKKFVVQ